MADDIPLSPLGRGQGEGAEGEGAHGEGTRRRAPRALRHVTFMIGLAITLALVVTAAVSSVYTPRDPLEMSIEGRLQAPTPAHPLRADTFARTLPARPIRRAITS